LKTADKGTNQIAFASTRTACDEKDTLFTRSNLKFKRAKQSQK
jgi:hypothetical protein